MNKRQKAIVIEFIAVMAVTAIAIAAMINFKDWVNRSEAMRAMEQLGQIVLRYRQAHRAVPPKSYIDNVKENLQGWVRLGDLQYRALWIGPESGPEEILAYTEKNYPSSLLGDGFVVLRLDGRVEYLPEYEFKSLLAGQQSPAEIEMLKQ